MGVTSCLLEASACLLLVLMAAIQPVTGRQRECYHCAYRNMSGETVGLSRCQDRFYYRDIIRVGCDTGICMKEVTHNGDAISVTRGCVASCDQRQKVTTETAHYVHCCNQHLCNQGNTPMATDGGWFNMAGVALLMMFVVRVSYWWLTI